MLSLSEFFKEGVVALVSERDVDFTLNGSRDKAMPCLYLTDKQKDFFRHKTGITIERAAWAKQVHGTKILDVSKKFLKHEELLEADGLLTSDIHLPIAVRTADCLSIFIFDPRKKTIGLVHAGWRGSREGILQRAIERLRHGWNSNPQDLKIAFGPSIRSCCYQVGEEFKGCFPKEVQRKENGYYLDLVLVNRNQLRPLGVKDQNIFDCNVCTCCDSRFFSYRREGEKAGRMLSVMMLR